MRRVLHHAVDVLVVIEEAVQLRDVRVLLAQPPLYFGLFLHLAEEIVFLEKLFLDLFDGHYFLAPALHCFEDLAELARTDPFLEFEILNGKSHFRGRLALGRHRPGCRK